jgi:hypothetical protein
VWNDIRSTRSKPPGHAYEEERTWIYRAALQQFEDLMSAAESSGVAARPIPLFYALSQAGRAITAARRDGPDWKHRFHGLTVPETSLGLDAEVHARPGDMTSFQVVASTVGSDDLIVPCELGAVLASLPESAEMQWWDKRWPRSLRVDRISVESGSVEAQIVLVPEGIEIQSRYAFPPGSTVDCCPTAAGWQSPALFVVTDDHKEYGDVGTRVLTDRRPILQWPLAQGEPPEDQFDRIAPEYRFADARWLWPSLHPTETVLLTPLMTWWVLLFGFSMQARYEPAVWVSMLDIDSNSNPWAVMIENALNEGLRAVPQLVRDALFDRKLLL